MNIFIYLSCYFLLLLSILGYGNFFKKIFFKSQKFSIGYIGIFGIYLLIIISYIFTNKCRIVFINNNRNIVINIE